MSTTYKVCPICEARNHRNAALCATCGATIAEIAPTQDDQQGDDFSEVYDYRYGETDLAESSLGARGRIGRAILLLLLGAAVGIVGALALAPGFGAGEGAILAPAATTMPTRLAGPTVTPGAPTAPFTDTPFPSPAPTRSPTPAPCVRKVAEGDSLIAIVTRCGHGSLAILPTVMAMNGITDETLVQIGQEIIVPHPSPRPDPAALAAPGESASTAREEDQLERLAFDPFAPTLTPTLLPGLMWHVVSPDEDMIYIAASYGANIKTLSDLNPEINFYLCDFGQVYGGPECTVQLTVNQRVRVPAPPPTATRIPLTSGSATPSPWPTATYNAPIAQSPANDAYFSAEEQVTLRWVGVGRLGVDEVYQINLNNLDSGESFQADARELFLIIPTEWQSQLAGSHRYTWQVSVRDTATNRRSFATEARTFVWQGAERAET